MNEYQEVVLVNEHDEVQGKMEKLEVHRQAKLHRAFSIFVFDSLGNMLLQKRADNKYHSGGLWTNACCGHPSPNEMIDEAALRRLKEEMGIACSLNFGFKFLYKADVGNGVKENELDYVYVTVCNDEPQINPDEVSAFRYVSVDELKEEIKSSPENFTAWFKLMAEKVIDFYLVSRELLTGNFENETR